MNIKKTQKSNLSAILNGDKVNVYEKNKYITPINFFLLSLHCLSIVEDSGGMQLAVLPCWDDTLNLNVYVME